MRVETIGDATLYLGDSLEILPTLGKIDAVVTDPPYGIGIAANPVRQKHERMDWDNARPDISSIVSLGIPTMIWGGNYFGLPATQCFLIWDKLQGEKFSLAMCELVWTNLAGVAKILRLSAREGKEWHPTQKPIRVMEWCIGFIPDASTILDPFMGSGTTGVACINLGRKFIGIEIEPKYFDIACKRIKEAWVSRPRLFDEPKKPVQGELL
jgi:site-specific DNA-methyltransferase (adenine-specific)/modification methylase